MASQTEWEVCVPTAPSRAAAAATASRPKTLAGKRIGLFWNTKPNGDVFLLRIGELLKERFPDAELVKFFPGKADSAIGAPAAALKDAAEKSDVLLLSTGD
ncbi:MAG: hypothetical protein ABID87_00955 [Chloroflexota bacterium]